jgi:hypothetical protein
MIYNQQLTTAIAADRQARFRNSASRRRLVRRNRAPADAGQSTGFLTVVWPDEVDRVPVPQRDHCTS